MGDVYKALDTETGRLVTLKTINVTALPRTYTVPDAFQVIGRTCSWPIDTVGVCGSSPHETTITSILQLGVSRSSRQNFTCKLGGVATVLIQSTACEK